MKNLMILVCLSVLSPFLLTVKADDIYFKNGYMLKNVLVKDTSGAYVNVILANDTRKFLMNTIDHIVKNIFDPMKESAYIESDALKYMLENNPRERMSMQPMPTSRTVYPNLKFLPLSILAAGLAWDFLADATKLNDEIDGYKKLNREILFKDMFNEQIDNLEGHKTRKTALGIIFVTVGIVNTIISFKSIEVDLQSDQIKVSYNF